MTEISNRQAIIASEMSKALNRPTVVFGAPMAFSMSTADLITPSGFLK